MRLRQVLSLALLAIGFLAIGALKGEKDRLLDGIEDNFNVISKEDKELVPKGDLVFVNE